MELFFIFGTLGLIIYAICNWDYNRNSCIFALIGAVMIIALWITIWQVVIPTTEVQTYTSNKFLSRSINMTFDKPVEITKTRVHIPIMIHENITYTVKIKE